MNQALEFAGRRVILPVGTANEADAARFASMHAARFFRNRKLPTPYSEFPDNHFQPAPMAATVVAEDTGGMQTHTGSSAASTVFIVDDSVAVCDRLCELMKQIDGIAVAGVAATPKEAIAGIAATRPDVVVIDVHLRDGSGIEVLAAIVPAMPDIVFIVLSNVEELFYRAAYFDAGASYFFDKSMEFEKVADVVGRLQVVRH